MIKLRLAYPPSANKYLGRGQNGQTYLKKAAIEYHHRTILDVRQQLGNNFKAIDKPFIMLLIAVPPDKRARDTTNIEKVLKDSLELKINRAGVYTNDKLAWNFSVKWEYFRKDDGELDYKIDTKKVGWVDVEIELI